MKTSDDYRSGYRPANIKTSDAFVVSNRHEASEIVVAVAVSSQISSTPFFLSTYSIRDTIWVPCLQWVLPVWL